MGKAAELWKKAKDISEKAWKVAQKEGKTEVDFPKFKSDFQKTLEKFESAHELLEKLKQKLVEQEKLVKTSAADCRKVIAEYTKAINDAKVTGPTSTDACKGKMLGALEWIEDDIEMKLNR